MNPSRPRRGSSELSAPDRQAQASTGKLSLVDGRVPARSAPPCHPAAPQISPNSKNIPPPRLRRHYPASAIRRPRLCKSTSLDVLRCLRPFRRSIYIFAYALDHFLAFLFRGSRVPTSRLLSHLSVFPFFISSLRNSGPRLATFHSASNNGRGIDNVQSTLCGSKHLGWSRVTLSDSCSILLHHSSGQCDVRLYWTGTNGYAIVHNDIARRLS